MRMYDEAQAIIYGVTLPEQIRQKALENLTKAKFAYGDYHAVLIANACVESARVDDFAARITATVDALEARIKKLESEQCHFWKDPE